MKSRKLSSRYIEGQLAQIDGMHDRAWAELTETTSPELDGFSQIKMSYKAFRRLLKNRTSLAHVTGFWSGWGLAKGDQS